MDTTESLANLLVQLSRVVKGLNPADAESLATGAGKIVYLPPTARVVEKSRALDLAIRALQKLDEESLAELEAGGGKVVVLKRGHRIVAPIDVPTIASEISRLNSEDEILGFLDADTRIGPPLLRKIADELGIVLPPTAKAKPAIQQHIARSLVSYKMPAPRY